MSFILGMIISAGLLLCLAFEACEIFRPLFSVIFLGGIIAAMVYLAMLGILLTPWFILGFMLNILLFIPVIKNSKEDKK